MDGEENKIYEKIENMAKEQYKNQIKKLKEELNSILLSLNDKLQCQKILKIISLNTPLFKEGVISGLDGKYSHHCWVVGFLHAILHPTHSIE